MHHLPRIIRFLQSKLTRYFGLGFATGAIVACGTIYMLRQPASPLLKIVRQSSITPDSGYKFTDPLITVSMSGDSPSQVYAGLESDLEASMAEAQQGGSLMMSSVYFRDINASDGFTINPTTMYAPASLTKVPLAMAYYDLAEDDPSVLDDEIAYSGVPDLNATEQVRSPIQLEPGKSYTVEALIEHMLKNSDNNAEQLLANHLAAIGKLQTLSSLFTDLGIKADTDTPDDATIRSYALLFRVLYNATYLDRDYSEKTLELLSEGDFKSGISAGVASSTVVAQKFAEARIPDSDGNIVGAELHNCGIVYLPNHSYILCVMTKGASIASLEGYISNISRTVFTSVEGRYAAETSHT